MPLRQRITKAFVASFATDCQHCANEINRALLVFDLISLPITSVELEKYAFTIVRQDNRFLVGLKCGAQFEIEVDGTEIEITAFAC